ncbi:hypothetical protein K8P10_001068 [Leucobacter sp. Psy1]|nr:hypothetical protein K8P10_001068 [Leucobacter sp. Psy1]
MRTPAFVAPSTGPEYVVHLRAQIDGCFEAATAVAHAERAPRIHEEDRRRSCGLYEHGEPARQISGTVIALSVDASIESRS